MASEFFGRQRECRFYTAGCGNKMAVSVTGPRAVNEAQSYRVYFSICVMANVFLTRYYLRLVENFFKKIQLLYNECA